MVAASFPGKTPARTEGGFSNMTEAAAHRSVPALKMTLVAAVIATAGCSAMNAPTAQSIAGLSPSGNVTITEDFVTGVGGGSGTLEYQGRTCTFKVLGTVVGPGGGVEKISASGPSISSPTSPISRADIRKAPARPVLAHRAAAICGWKTTPA